MKLMTRMAAGGLLSTALLLGGAAAQAQEIPLQTVIRAINYAQAGEIASLLTTSRGTGGSSSRILSPRGSVSVDRRTNKLILKTGNE